MINFNMYLQIINTTKRDFYLKTYLKFYSRIYFDNFSIFWNTFKIYQLENLVNWHKSNQVITF